MSETAALEMLCEGTEYELLAGDGGAFYILRAKSEHMRAQLEGDDAIRFKADYEAIRTQYPAWPADQTLAQLWDQGGYSWLAAQEDA